MWLIPRLRGLVHKAFTPRLVEGMRQRAQTLADELLDGVARRGEMDLSLIHISEPTRPY